MRHTLTMIDINLTILPIHSSKVHLEGEKVLTLLTFLGDKFRSLSKNEKGVTTVEYAVMLGLVALAIALAAPNIRDSVIQVFEDTSNALKVEDEDC